MAPPPSPESLEDLLRRAQAGNAEALTQLLQRYERRVQLAARSLLRPALRHVLDSLDLVQSVHRALLPGLREGRYTFADEGQLIALAVTVLRHKVRRSARQARTAPADRAARPAEPAPDEVVAARDLLTRLLGELPAADRRLVELRLQNFSTAEIAADLHCTPAILRARLSRLRRRLREGGYTEPL